jgi:hypothetical protein
MIKLLLFCNSSIGDNRVHHSVKLFSLSNQVQNSNLVSILESLQTSIKTKLRYINSSLLCLLHEPVAESREGCLLPDQCTNIFIRDEQLDHDFKNTLRCISSRSLGECRYNYPVCIWTRSHLGFHSCDEASHFPYPLVRLPNFFLLVGDSPFVVVGPKRHSLRTNWTSTTCAQCCTSPSRFFNPCCDLLPKNGSTFSVRTRSSVNESSASMHSCSPIAFHDLCICPR